MDLGSVPFTQKLREIRSSAKKMLRNPVQNGSIADFPEIYGDVPSNACSRKFESRDNFDSALPVKSAR